MNNLPSINVPKLSLPAIMKSKRFWVILATMLVDMFICLQPDFEGNRAQLIQAATAAGMFLAGLYGIEDVMLAFRNGAQKDKYLE